MEGSGKPKKKKPVIRVYAKKTNPNDPKSMDDTSELLAAWGMRATAPKRDKAKTVKAGARPKTAPKKKGSSGGGSKVKVNMQ